MSRTWDTRDSCELWTHQSKLIFWVRRARRLLDHFSGVYPRYTWCACSIPLGGTFCKSKIKFGKYLGYLPLPRVIFKIPWGWGQRWASTHASWSAGRRWSNTRHSIKRIKYRNFSNNRRQKSRPIHRPISIGAEPHFYGSNFSLSMKKNWDLYLDFSKFVSFVKNFLHVILFLGVGDIPEEIWSITTISNRCPPLPPTPTLPAPPCPP